MTAASTTKILPHSPADRACGAASDAGRVGAFPTRQNKKARNIPEIDFIRANEGELSAKVAAAILKRNKSLLTLSAVARRAGISLSTLRRRRKAGLIHPVPLGCRCIRFAENRELSEFIQHEKEKAAS